MKRIRNWVITKLGGVTKDQTEMVRGNYEKWAVENLTGKNGEITPDVCLYYPFDGDDIIVIRSKIEICNGLVKGIKIAPWCREVVVKGIRML